MRQALGRGRSTLPENGYPGEYLVDLAREYLAERGTARRRSSAAGRRGPRSSTSAATRWRAWSRASARCSRDYGVDFDAWTSEQRDVRDKRLPERALDELAERGLTYEAGRRALVPLDRSSATTRTACSGSRTAS